MIDASVLKFLSKLHKNNNKAWFDDHRSDYDNCRNLFIQSTGKMIQLIAAFDAPIGTLQPKDCIFRINRDVRFSKDKQPYKNNMAAYFNKDGKKGLGAGYYLHIEPGKSFVAAGIWMPEPGGLSRIRQEIDYNFPEWKKLFQNTRFKKLFSKGINTDNILSRPPKGYTDDNPAIAYLKLKSFVVTRPFSDQEVTGKGFLKEVANTFEAAKPMVDFINRSLD